LSYTSFKYEILNTGSSTFDADQDEHFDVTVDLENTGKMKGDEVVQLYIRDVESEEIQPMKKLRAFERVSLEPGSSETISFTLSKDDFSFWSEENDGWFLEVR